MFRPRRRGRCVAGRRGVRTILPRIRLAGSGPLSPPHLGRRLHEKWRKQGAGWQASRWVCDLDAVSRFGLLLCYFERLFDLRRRCSAPRGDRAPAAESDGGQKAGLRGRGHASDFPIATAAFGCGRRRGRSPQQRVATQKPKKPPGWGLARLEIMVNFRLIQAVRCSSPRNP